MYCLRCNGHTPEDHDHCVHCGERLSSFEPYDCDECGQTINDVDCGSICLDCGDKFDQDVDFDNWL